MKFNVEINLTEDELNVLKENAWFEYYTPCYRAFGIMTYDLKQLILKNVIEKKTGKREEIYELTHVGRLLFQEYKHKIDTNEI